jgi:glucokinase
VRIDSTVDPEIYDAHVATLGEKWLGAGRDVDDMAMLTLGTGVGGGLVLNGKIWHGMKGMAGEFGHFTVEPEGHPCGCGSRGCLEQYASATAVVRMAREVIAAGNSPKLAQLAELNSKSIYDLATQGDEGARSVFQRVGRALGIVLADMVNGLNLPLYVIGGGAASAWDAFAPTMFAELQTRSVVYAATNSSGVQTGRKTLITQAQLGSDAGLLGAARLPKMWTSAP